MSDRATAAAGSPPALYIYYLSSRLPAPIPMETDGFIGNWEEDGTSFLFFSEAADAVVEGLVQESPGVELLDRFHMGYEEWQGGRIRPQSVAGFRLMPPWAASEASGEIPLIIDPGVVFGNGLHPTTHDCLEALVMAFRRMRVRRMLDLGTGTGILAVAGARLGCRQVLAVDFNLLAVETARRNVMTNRLADVVLAVQGDALDMAGSPTDLLVANIHYDVMRRLMANPRTMQDAGGVILSGLLRGEVGDIRRQIQQQGIRIVHEWQRQGVWHTIYGEHGPH